MEYAQYLENKAWQAPSNGIDGDVVIPDACFDWQADVIRWALRVGRSAIWADCGLGKTLMQLVWASNIPGDVLIIAPLAVAAQTVREGEKFGITAAVSRDGSKRGKITVTNYEQVLKFDPSDFSGVVLDESSILKSHDGKYRTELIRRFSSTPYRLCCTATPAPNDTMELANHAEFLGVQKRAEFLATWFTHDGGNTSQWRLKKHAVEPFWRWVASWAVMMRKPSDLGYDDCEFELPPLEYREHIIETGVVREGALFVEPVQTMAEQRKARRDTLERRAHAVADMVNASDEQWVVWCELNDESELATKLINGAVEVAGSTKDDQKIDRMIGFADGRYRVIVTKPKIAGFGMNWQNCRNVVFVGVTHSFESTYQAIRRCWRFGQTDRVTATMVTTDIESAVLDNLRRKQADHDRMVRRMSEAMREVSMESVKGAQQRKQDTYMEDEEKGDGWIAYQGDSVEMMRHLENESIHYSVFSPPFASLYTYSASDRDMGNCKDEKDFAEHFKYLTSELFRVLKSGRLVSFHCMQLPKSKERDGVIGLKDFRGQLIRIFEDAGFVYHSEVVIWKDPVTAMQRTKAIGLLWKQLKKDSCMSRQGIPDYVVTMRKPGVNEEPVGHKPDDFPVERWQKIASPVWMDINPSDTLQRESAREEDDERHICPLQLEVIRRCLELWSNPGDTVLSPFMGIGSEGYVSLQEGRRFVGCELKASYYKQAVNNLNNVHTQLGLF